MIYPYFLRDILVYSINKYDMPLPVSKRILYKWAEGTDIPREGEYILFTGGLYQLYPYIKYFTKMLYVIDNFEFTKKIQSTIQHVLSELDFNLEFKPPVKEIERANNILKKIAYLIRKSGVDLGYMYEKDMYNGAIIYDMGMMDEFKKIAKKIYENLSHYKNSIIVTIDPHTTHILRNIIPKVIGTSSFRIKNYIEIIEEGVISGKDLGSSKTITIHDPCLYARGENIIVQPRKLLEQRGYRILEPPRSREYTYCCGGPIESLFPKLSKKIASERLGELSSKSNIIVTMCPICLTNLSSVKTRELLVKDLVELIM